MHEVGPDDVRLAPVARLAAAASEGDHQSWLELVSRFAGTVANVARRHRLAPAEISAVQQATWLRLVESLHRIQNPAGLEDWLAATARHESLRLLRHRQTERPDRSDIGRAGGRLSGSWSP
jgi:DNA-directed RNA polymerase specialized sigma24 family protein